jgi:hypothetical protein
MFSFNTGMLDETYLALSRRLPRRVAFRDRSLIVICRPEDPGSQEHQQLLEL